MSKRIYIVKDKKPFAAILISKTCNSIECKSVEIFIGKVLERTGCKIGTLYNGVEIRKKGYKTILIIGKDSIDYAQKMKLINVPLKDRVPNEEGFDISTISKKGITYILVNSTCDRGTLFGVGKLLRETSFTDNYATVPEINITSAPEHKIRATLITSHIAGMGYGFWKEKNWEEYVEELALWGMNTIFYFPLQFGNERRFIWKDKNWQIFLKVPKIVKSYGLNVGIHVNLNDVFIEDAPNFKLAENGIGEYIDILTERSMVCPQDKKAQKVILNIREDLFKKLPFIDFITIDITDGGGCGCKLCKSSYITTYLNLCKEIAHRLKKHHPKAKVIINNQAISRKGMEEIFCPYLNKEDSDWVDYIQYDVYGTALTVNELKSKISKRFKDRIIVQAEITMRDAWGRYGAVPWVKNFDHSLAVSYDHVLSSVAWSPKLIPPILCADDPLFRKAFELNDINGAITYSEGIHDDIPKIVWCQKNWSLEREPVDILREYCRWYFGEHAVTEIEQAILRMESISDYRTRKGGTWECLTGLTKLIDFSNAAIVYKALETLNLLERAEPKLPEYARSNWRWKILRLRAMIDSLIVKVQRSKVIGIFEKKEINLLKREIIALAKELYNICKYTPIVGPMHTSMDGVEDALDAIIAKSLEE